MRRLGDIVWSWSRDQEPPLELSEADLQPRSRRTKEQTRAPASDRKRLERLAKEISQVAEYVTRLKREIGALKAGEIHSKRLPETVSELNGVQSATREAVDRIMAAAEAMMERSSSDKRYAAFVLERVTQIMEACSFQDIAGQRIGRAVEAINDVERRLERFTKAVKIADAADLFDRQAILREARREVLILEGPQTDGQGIAQSAVDKLFG